MLLLTHPKEVYQLHDVEVMRDPFDVPFDSPFNASASTWRIPEGVTPHEDTIRVLRAIGGAGEVTSKELLALAYYLNEHRDARHSWPGESLTTILAAMFEGHTPSRTDRDAVHTDIEAIERECYRVAITEEDEETAIPMSSIRMEDFQLPPASQTVEIKCPDSETRFQVDLHHQTCNCPTWPNHRSRLKLNDPRRACSCMVEAYHQLIQNDELPGIQPIFKDIMADRAHRGRSIDVHSKWKLVKIRMRPHVVSYGSKVWSYVYAPDGAGFTRFAFNNEEKRWSFGQCPRSAKTIEAFLKEAQAGRLD